MTRVERGRRQGGLIEGCLATCQQGACYYRPYNVKAAADEWGVLANVCACVYLKLHLVSIVVYLLQKC